jgi:hypothetical protein
MKNNKIAEYDVFVLVRGFEDVPPQTKGTVLMFFEGASHAEVDLSGGEFANLTYTVPLEYLVALDDANS